MLLIHNRLLKNAARKLVTFKFTPGSAAELRLLEAANSLQRIPFRWGKVRKGKSTFIGQHVERNGVIYEETRFKASPSGNSGGGASLCLSQRMQYSQSECTIS